MSKIEKVKNILEEVNNGAILSYEEIAQKAEQINQLFKQPKHNPKLEADMRRLYPTETSASMDSAVEQKLREKIARRIAEIAGTDFDLLPDSYQSRNLNVASKIIFEFKSSLPELAEEAGVIKTDQEILEISAKASKAVTDMAVQKERERIANEIMNFNDNYMQTPLGDKEFRKMVTGRWWSILKEAK